MNRQFLETIRVEDGVIKNLEYHQRRYAQTLKALSNLKPQRLEDFIDAPKNGLFRCRLIYNIDNNNIFVEFIEYKKRDINKLKLIESDIVYPFKSLNRDNLDALFAKKGECDDVLIVKDGLVLDTTIANIAFFDGKTWLTPHKPLLEGTTISRYLNLGYLSRAKVGVDDLLSFKKVALLNAMIDFDIIMKNTQEIFC